MPDVVIKYGHPDSLKHDRKGAYVVAASRNPKRTHSINKASLWKHYRQALSAATLDAIEGERPDLYATMQSALSDSHHEGKRLLFEHIHQTNSEVRAIGLSLQLLIWDKLPQPKHRRGASAADPADVGQYDFSTVNDWRGEAVLMMAEAHKLGWNGMTEKLTKTERKHRSTITRKRNEIDKLSRLEILAGKRRRLLREIVATETKLSAARNLQSRAQILRRFMEPKTA